MSVPRSDGTGSGPLAPVFVEGASGSGATFDPGSQRLEPGAEMEPPGRTSGESEPPTFQHPRVLLRHLGREAARSMRVSRVGIWRFEGAGRSVRLVTRYRQGDGSVEEDQEYPGHLAASLWSLLGRVRALAVDDTQTSNGPSEPLREWIGGQGVRAVLAIPARAGARLVGFVTFEEGRSPRSWTSADRDLAASLAVQVTDPLTRLGPGDRGHVEEAVPDSPDPGVAEPDTSISQAGGTDPAPSAPGGRRVVPETEGRPPIGIVPAARRSQVQRLPRLQGAAILGAEEAIELLEALDVQDGYLELLESALGDRAEDLEMVAEARAVSSRLRAGVDRFLAYIRGGIADRKRAELNELIPRMIPALSREAGPHVRLRIAPTASTLRVDVGAGLLERALVHLVRNAREASEPGQDIRIAWGPHSHESPEGKTSRWARIRVSDQGRGIPREALPWLFEPSYSSRPGDRPLRGLGLPLVQSVVEGHGGWVEVRSERTAGTEVDILLPIAGAPAARTTAGSRSEELEASEAAPERVPRILLLEDEPLLARLLLRMLTRNGFMVDLVDNPADAETRGLELRDALDLVITERELAGGVSGAELAEVWRSVRPDLPVVILDRNAPLDPEDGAPTTMGGVPLIRRPFHPADVLRVVRDALETNRPETNTESDLRAAGSPEDETNATGESAAGGIGRDLTH